MSTLMLWSLWAFFFKYVNRLSLSKICVFFIPFLSFHLFVSKSSFFGTFFRLKSLFLKNSLFWLKIVFFRLIFFISESPFFGSFFLRLKIIFFHLFFFFLLHLYWSFLSVFILFFYLKTIFFFIILKKYFCLFSLKIIFFSPCLVEHMLRNDSKYGIVTVTKVRLGSSTFQNFSRTYKIPGLFQCLEIHF